MEAEQFREKFVDLSAEKVVRYVAEMADNNSVLVIAILSMAIASASMVVLDNYSE